jgi:hypothetical protein
LVRSRWFGLALLGLMCTAGGALLSSKLRPDPPSADAKPGDHDAGSAADDGPGGGAQPDCARIDEMIREGRYKAAQSLCRDGTMQPTGSARDALDFRAPSAWKD